MRAGRSSGFTTGIIKNVNATIDVDFPGGGVARFCRQIVTTYMSNPGDSGSIVATRDEEAVGLLFADSLGSTHSYANSIRDVETELGIRVTE